MNKQQLSDLYQNRFDQTFLPRKKAIWSVLCHDFFQKWVKPNAVVVDVACGYGEFINHIAAQRKIGIDLNPDTPKHLGPDVEFFSTEATELSRVGCDVADIVFTSNFLEHLPDKKTLDLFLDQVLKTLKPNGQFLIMGPNLRYLPGAYWDYYDHHLGLTHLSLIEALRLKGFKINHCTDRFLPYTTQSKLPTHPFLVKLYLKFPLAWRLLGKQFFIVATK